MFDASLIINFSSNVTRIGQICLTSDMAALPRIQKPDHRQNGLLFLAAGCNVASLPKVSGWRIHGDLEHFIVWTYTSQTMKSVHELSKRLKKAIELCNVPAHCRGISAIFNANF